MNVVEKAKEEVVKTAQSIYREGLVFETWGNVSCRPTENQIVITPSGIPYEELKFVDIVVVDISGKVEQGKWKPSTELPLHLNVYRSRRDARAIIHTHSPCATAFAVSRKDIPVVIDDLAQVVGGPVRVADYALPGSSELAQNAVRAFGGEGNAILLSNHGLVVLGEDLSIALQRCRIIERNAQIVLWSKLLGEPFILEDKEVARLRNSFLLSYGQKENLTL